MFIQEMHTTFRTLGQQMGLQLVRSILPESIDTYLNDAILEWTRNHIINNVSYTYQDKVTTQNNSISQINGVRSLYKQRKLLLSKFNIDSGSYSCDLLLIIDSMFYTSFEVIYETKENNVTCRFIESDKLGQTLKDYCNAPSWDYPIITMYNDNYNNDKVELFIGTTDKIPKELVVKYIKLPQIVKLATIVVNNKDCDLPEYCHYEIVELAVNKYFESVGSTSKNVSA